MAKMKHILLLTVILTSACESNEKKIERLNREQAIASLVYQNWEARADSLLKTEKGLVGSRDLGPKTRAALDTMAIAKTKLDLANRELNRFMNGR